MKKNGFQELMTEFGCLVLDDTAFGEEEGYPYSVQFVRGGEPAELLFRFVVDGNARPVAKALKEKGIAHMRWKGEQGENTSGGVLVGMARIPSDFYAKGTVMGALAAAPRALAEAGLARPQECPLCGNANCDVYAWLSDGYRPTHSGCLLTRLELPVEDEVTPLTIRGNYFTGILGAVVGAVFGTLPNFAQAFSKLTINAPLYAFIPVLSALVYRLFRGKARRGISSVIVLLASLGAAFALELVWFWLSRAETGGYTVSFAETTALYFSTHTVLSTVHEMLICLIFLVIGCIPAGIFLQRYAKGGTRGGEQIRGARYVRESATPVDRPKKASEAPPPPQEPQDDYMFYI